MKRNRRRVNWVVVVTSLVFAVSCSGGGCGGCAAFEPIPGGFPAAERNPNAVQVRVSQTGLAAITADPAKLITAIAGGMNGVLSFNAPVSCSGSTPTCCPGGNPQNTCGPINIDFNQAAGDLPRLEVRPAQGGDRVDVTVRARVKTAMDVPVRVPIAGDCGLRIDTAAGSVDDIRIDAPINFQQDPTSGTTRVVVGTVSLTQLASEDVSLTGGFGCQAANLGISFVIGILRDQLTGVIQETIQEQTCKACPSGDVAECGTFATACTGGVCMQGSECMQELGLSGRARGTGLFGSFSPGTTGAIDLYEVAGGYATSNTNGLALGLLGGILPGGAPRDRCGPPAAGPPARPAIPLSPFFQGNTRPDTGQPFGVGIGIHRSQLEQFAYAGYDGGLLCLTLDNDTVSQLSTDTLSLVSRSLGRLVEGNAPMAVGLRPQRPPVLTLGKNVFSDDGQGNVTLTEPLIDVKFTGMEVDFFTAIDDQFVRVFTVVADVHLPVGLQVTSMGELAPVLGNTEGAFTNLSVKNSELVTEPPAELAALFPTILNLVLPQLSGGLPSIALPSIGGLQLDVTAVTGVPVSPGGTDVSFLAIYANLAPAALAPAVETTLSLGEIAEPDAAVAADPRRWRGARPPAVSLDLGGDAEDLEFSYRIDGGAWSAWSRNPRPTLSPGVFWLPGTHRIEARARRLGQPATIDPTPASIEVTLGAGAPVRRSPVRGFHGQPGEAGCDCATGGSAGGAAPLALVLGVVLAPLRRVRRRLARLARGARRLGAVAWLAAIAMLPGCDCGGNYCGDAACLEGELPGGGIGRFTSVAADDQRVLVATYDHGLGDLVVVDVTDPATPRKLAVDGIPRDATPIHAEGTYRDGIAEPGPDVGAWTSIALSDGLAKVAYQDREAGALKYAFENKRGEWDSYVVEESGGGEIGRYASLAIDAEGRPAIAYLALGLDDGAGKRITELRVARSTVRTPDATDWSSHVIAAAPGTCAGLCGPGEACVADAAAETCKAVTADCTGACGDGEACIAGACTAAIEAPTTATLASGTGLFVSLVALPDGRLAAAYHDRTARALKLAVETAAGSNEFTETELHGGPTGDRGMWASAVADEAGVIHIAYQDAIGDQLLYTTWNGAPGVPEVVDDGQRPGDRTHPVGAGASIYLAGGAPAIAYQDGLTADVYVATRSAASWTPTALSTGPLLDGISIGAAVGPGGVPYLAWDRLDPAVSPPHTLAVENP